MTAKKEYGSEEWIKVVEEISGFTPESLGGGIIGWSFSLPNEKQIIFGYCNDRFGFDICEEGGTVISCGEIDGEDTPANEADFMAKKLKENGFECAECSKGMPCNTYHKGE